MRDIILLNDLKFDKVINLPILKIKYIPKDIDLSVYEALIFTSKNAIYSIDSFNKDWLNMPAYCIAQKTAEVVDNLNGRVEFTGLKSLGNDFALELIPKLKNKKCLYIRAFKTVSALSEILKENNIDIDELITYKTACSQSIFDQPKDNSIIIFSSPSTVECFFKRFSWNESYTAIAIGKTTSKYLPKNINCFVSDTQSIDSCVNLALTFQ